MRVRAFKNLAQIRVLVGFWEGVTPSPLPENSETYMNALLHLHQLGLLQTGQRLETQRDQTLVSARGGEVLQQLLVNAVVFRDLVDLSAFVDVACFDEVPVTVINSIPHLIQSRVLIEMQPGRGWHVTTHGHELLVAMTNMEIEVLAAATAKGPDWLTCPETVIAKPRTTEPVQPFQVWQKHAQALEGLLHQSLNEAVEMEAVLGRATQKPFLEEENAVRLANAKLLQTILWDLYCFNSEHGTTNEQDERLYRMGFTLFNNTAERLAKAEESGVEILQDTLREFDGYAVDLFKTDSGALGLTIERAPAHEDNPSVDIFVSKDLTISAHGVNLPRPSHEDMLAKAELAAQRRAAMANLMRNSVKAHYKDCPAESGGVCNCSWLVDGDVLRTWLDETTVFTQR